MNTVGKGKAEIDGRNASCFHEGYSVVSGGAHLIRTSVSHIGNNTFYLLIMHTQMFYKYIRYKNDTITWLETPHHGAVNTPTLLHSVIKGLRY